MSNVKLADLLRNEIDIHKELPWLQEEVVKRIKSNGVFSIICDTHVNDISTYSLPFKYWSPVETWARKEGFNTDCKYNNYGVKHLIITL